MNDLINHPLIQPFGVIFFGGFPFYVIFCLDYAAGRLRDGLAAKIVCILLLFWVFSGAVFLIALLVEVFYKVLIA